MKQQQAGSARASKAAELKVKVKLKLDLRVRVGRVGEPAVQTQDVITRLALRARPSEAGWRVVSMVRGRVVSQNCWRTLLLFTLTTVLEYHATSPSLLG